ncbi:AMP-binding protein [Paracoccus luteus]|uniref:AMP-binding protein n=1 Tax=Paracoccus luteus TaxID=2508543 RepID=UPI00106F22AA|nr:AMP-binding protein [Paracoccus luteus]
MTPLAMTLHDLLADNLPDRADAPAIVEPDRTVTYAALMDEAAGVAGWLAAQGVARGDRVIVHLRKSASEVAAMMGAARIGAVVVNVNAQWTAEQLAYVIADSRAAAVLTGPVPAGRLGEGAPPVLVRGAQGWADAGPPPPVAPVLDSDLAMILYTSGSTGQPKGVMLTHHNVLTGARAVARYLGLGPDDRLVSVLPYSFDYGLNQLTTMLLLGGTVIHQPVPMPAEIVAAINRHGATGLACVPPLWGQVVRHLADNPTPMPTLRRVTNTGGKIPDPILALMPQVFPGVAIHLMYGLTEAFRSTHLPPHLFATKAGAIGRAIPGADVRVLRPDGTLAGPGEDGELIHAGPLVSLGYWGKPEQTAEKFRPCPALGGVRVVHSGDTVRMDADGDLWFVGRRDAMIKTMGFRLSPEEVEEHAYASGLVADAVAWGVEDDTMGQAVHLAVAPRDGFLEPALIDHFRARAAHYMMPRRIHAWDGPMPRISSGKLDRKAVAAACAAKDEA